MTRQESQTIEVLRLPMALAVVCVHAVSLFPFLEAQTISFQTQCSWYNIVYCLLSERLVNLALPFFFMVSGFLFFQHLDQWSWEMYSNKLKHRIYTLLLPYLCWNILRILSSLFLCFLGAASMHSAWHAFMAWYDGKGGFLHMMWDCFEMNVDRVDWFGFANSSYLPVHMPMWFIRDLMVLSCISPLFFWPLRHWPKLSVFVMTFCLVSGVWIHLPGFSSFSAFYFCIGALLAIHRMHLFPSKTWSVVVLLIVWVISMLYLLNPLTDVGEKWVGLLSCLSVVCGLFAAMGLAGKMIGGKKLNLPTWLGPASFFVFSIHSMQFFLYYSPVQISAHVLMKVFGAETGSSLLIGILFTPMLAFFICMLLFFVMKRFCPWMLGLLTGKRFRIELL